MNLEFRTAGESHGKGILVLISGLPAGVPIDLSFIEQELARRKRGFGVSPRMHLEEDRIEVLGGLRWGKTLGSPLTFWVQNTEYDKWQPLMDPEGERPKDYEEVTIPRPGHADLSGLVKYRFKDIRNVIERASARETVGRCIAGAVAKLFLASFGVRVGGFVESIGGVRVSLGEISWEEAFERALSSPLATVDREEEMKARIAQAMAEGDTLGGTFVVAALGVVPGVGSYVEVHKRLDSRLAFYLMGIPGIKGVEIGDGFRGAELPGSAVHDAIFYDARRSPFPFFRKTNRSGGIEGGVSTGEVIWARCAMKPIPTLRRGLPSVDIVSKREVVARYERSDVCAVPRALVVGEGMLAWVLADAYMEKFGGDTLEETLESFRAYCLYLESFKLQEGC